MSFQDAINYFVASGSKMNLSYLAEIHVSAKHLCRMKIPLCAILFAQVHLKITAKAQVNGNADFLFKTFGLILTFFFMYLLFFFSSLMGNSFFYVHLPQT